MVHFELIGVGLPRMQVNQKPLKVNHKPVKMPLKVPVPFYRFQLPLSQKFDAFNASASSSLACVGVFLQAFCERSTYMHKRDEKSRLQILNITF